MPIYKNIDGTTKSTFKIGSSGIVLSYKDVQEGLENVRTLMVNGKAVLYDDENIKIPRELCYKIEYIENNTKVKFYLKRFDETTNSWEYTDFIINKNGGEGGGVTGPAVSTAGNLAAFKDNTGKALMDSTYSVATTVTNNENQIPTAAAVKAYIGQVETPLDLRLKGIIN